MQHSFLVYLEMKKKNIRKLPYYRKIVKKRDKKIICHTIISITTKIIICVYNWCKEICSEEDVEQP